MSTVGRMDGAFFVSRTELLAWVNGLLQLNITRVEQCSNGAVYCQITDACHPGAVAMKKVNWMARDDHQCIPNFKVLQQAFDKVGIARHIEVDKLIRGKYQDNLEMLQWIKTYYERTANGADYEALSRRFGDMPEWARSPDGSLPGRSSTREAPGRPSPAASAHGQTAPGRGGRASPTDLRRSVQPAEFELLKEEHERLREEVVDLKITVDGLETERDFYFQKLRDIEILCQALDQNPDPNITVGKFVEDVQRILYAKDEEEEDFADNQQDRAPAEEGS